MLIVFSGLPGTGKSTISKRVARDLWAMHLRIDYVELALYRSVVSAEAMGAKEYDASGAIALG